MTQNFEQYLANVARGYASLVTKLAKGYSESSRVRSTIASTVERKSTAEFIIRTSAGDPVKAPDARAREYGSGVWARRGPKGKILIRARNKPLLIFPWDTPTSPVSGGSVNVPRDKYGNVRLKQVEHPGIDADNEGKGYLHPAMNDARKILRERIKKEGAAAIKLDLRESFNVR